MWKYFWHGFKFTFTPLMHNEARFPISEALQFRRLHFIFLRLAFVFVRINFLYCSYNVSFPISFVNDILTV